MVDNSSIKFPFIRSKMAYHNLTKKAMQSALCVSFPTLKCKLSGKSQWTASELIKMSEMFNCTIEELLKG